MLKSISNNGQRHLLFWVIYIGYSHIYERIAYPGIQYFWLGLVFHYLSFVAVFYFTFFASNKFFKEKKQLSLPIFLLLVAGLAAVFGLQLFKDYYVFGILSPNLTNYILLFGEVFLIITFAVFFSIFQFTEALNQTIFSNLVLTNERNLELNKAKRNKAKLVKYLDKILNETEPNEVIDDLKEFRELVDFLINNTHKALITIALEIENLQRYIHLYHLRVGRFNIFNLQIDGIDTGWEIPHKSILTLIENAIKHGDLDYPVLIKIEFESDSAKILIRNRIKTQTSVIHSSNIGLKNLKERLQLHLGGRFRFESGGVDGWFDVVIEI